jgi:outer membrane lipoprotein SlyB
MKLTTLPVLMTSISIAACSQGPYEPIVDGPKNIVYQKDLAECRQLSLQKKKTNDGAIGGAVIGGLIGATESAEDAIAGAVVGGLIGTAEEGSKVSDEQDAIVFRCLQGRGHKVVG